MWASKKKRSVEITAGFFKFQFDVENICCCCCRYFGGSEAGMPQTWSCLADEDDDVSSIVLCSCPFAQKLEIAGFGLLIFVCLVYFGCDSVCFIFR